MSDDERAIRELSAAQSAAIIAADVETLDRLLDDSFTATHITGYVQPKDEWLADITSGQMRYHSTEEILWDLTVDGDHREPHQSGRHDLRGATGVEPDGHRPPGQGGWSVESDAIGGRHILIGAGPTLRHCHRL